MSLIEYDIEILKHPEFFNWIYWNLILWAIGLIIHGLWVFGSNPLFVKDWEERQIKKYMKKEARAEETIGNG